MNNEMPESLLEAVAYFADEDRAHDFFVKMRWPEGVRCAHCGSENVGKMVRSGNRRLWNCKACKKQFTAKIGTVFNKSPLPLSKWLPALWLVVNAKNGISSCELARALKITQKSAWFMGHRIRASIQRGGGIVHSNGVFECDESYIGGKSRNMHADKRAQKITSNGPAGKSIVMGLLARHGENMPHSKVVARVVKTSKAHDLVTHVFENIPFGSEVHTDTLRSYACLAGGWEHKVVDHAEAYVQDGVHTNGLENFWSLLKRTLKGTYVHCAPFHLYRYLDEQTYRFNERKHKTGDQGRFMDAVKTTAGRRLTWGGLTGKEPKKTA
ncbi:MAG: IS1595 family transposase [Chthoniobacteraceae bacterium]|jgi:transposase-like protein